ncbi:hypothetical protein [Actinomadura chibensis]|uniref:Uncharacterized protein n=1 Tax=Actinomadura chibensis TaxID=392828 RepID=A0A5D0P011_9ACTN|nr:hypothetical protein [Actinomadura chibensis]TYB49758.1 hypothetical protein FXF69_12065 [Actinomadura chibensis]
MNPPTGDNGFEAELETEIQAELALAESSRPEEAAALPASEWLFDPADVEAEEIELRNLLGAVEELGESRRGETERP